MFSALRETVSRHWWVLLVRGLAGILFGILALTRPGITLQALVLLYGAYCLVDGVAALLGGYTQKFWQALLLGLVSIAAGVATFLYPGVTALVLLYFIAFWAIFHGVFDIAAAIQFRKVIRGEWLLALAGAMAIAFGAFILARPGEGALAVVLILAWYAIVSGALLVALSFRVKGLRAA